MTAKSFQRGLFGGAIHVDLPENYFDTSEIREIPDHQEVFLDRDGFSSITFDILERVTETSTDADALLYHLFDVVDEADRICVTTPIPVDLPKHLVPAYGIFASTRPMTNQDSGRDFTIIMMLVIRLEMLETDILVAVNVPYRGTQFLEDVIDLPLDVDPVASDQTFQSGLDILKTIVQTFEIQDWGLFGE